MSITFDTSVLGGSPYTVGAGINPYVLVFTSQYDAGANPGTVTFGGVSMDLVVNLADPGSGSTYPALFVFGLPNPVQGSPQTIVSTHAVFCVASYFGAGSVYPVYQDANGITTTIQEVDMFITPDTADSWVLSFGGQYSSIVSPLTLRETGSSFYFGDSDGAPNAIYEVAVDTVGNQYYQYCEFLLSPFVAPPVQDTNFFLVL